MIYVYHIPDDYYNNIIFVSAIGTNVLYIIKYIFVYRKSFVIYTRLRRSI